jgi:hypothetical protein
MEREGECFADGADCNNIDHPQRAGLPPPRDRGPRRLQRLASQEGAEQAARVSG